MPSAHTRVFLLALATLGGLSLASPRLQAQEQNTSQTAGQSPDTSAPADTGSQNAPGPIGGVEDYRLGGPTLGHSFLIPRLGLQELYDSNPGFSSSTGASQSDSITVLSGGLALQLMKRDSTLSLDYSARGLLYNTQTQPNGVVQQLNVAENLAARRWNFVLGEIFSYLPSSAFGLGGLGFLGGGSAGLPGVGGTTNFNPFLQPTQTIGTANVSQLSSSTVFQAQYMLGPRSSLNASGTVGYLHFFGDNLLNSRNVTARFGYDKSLTARDTINFSYTVSIPTYPSGIQGFYSQYLQMGYRRIVTGRLLVSVSAGPVITHFSAQPGQTTVPGGANQVNWSLNSSLDYKARRGTLGVQYTHAVTAGSGFLVGTIADQVTGGLTLQITRVWSGGVTGGYARNSSFRQTTQTGPTSAQSIFNYWHAGVFASRPLGHFSSISFFYNASSQTGNTTVCANGLACGPIALVQTAGVTFNWSTRPYRLE